MDNPYVTFFLMRFATLEQGEGDPLLIHNQKSSLLVHVMKGNVEQRKGGE